MLNNLWEYVSNNKFKNLHYQTWKIGNHAQEFENTAWNIATTMEISSFTLHKQSIAEIQLFMTNLNGLKNEWVQYCHRKPQQTKEETKLKITKYRYNIAPYVINLKRIRARSPVFINIGAVLNKYLPKSNKLIWFASRKIMSKQTKKMLRNIERVHYTANGYPDTPGYYRFVYKFGGTPVIKNNNNLGLPLEFQRLMKIINKHNYMIHDSMVNCYNCRYQYEAYFNTWCNLLNQLINNMQQQQAKIQSSL